VVPGEWDLTTAVGPDELQARFRLVPEELGKEGARLFLDGSDSGTPAQPWLRRIIDGVLERFDRSALSREGLADLLRIAVHRESPPGLEMLSLDVVGHALENEDRRRELADLQEAGEEACKWIGGAYDAFKP